MRLPSQIGFARPWARLGTYDDVDISGLLTIINKLRDTVVTAGLVSQAEANHIKHLDKHYGFMDRGPGLQASLPLNQLGTVAQLAVVKQGSSWLI